MQNQSIKSPSSCPRQCPNKSYAGCQEGVHKQSLRSKIQSGISRLYRSTSWLVRPSPLTREILTELYSLPTRIGWLYATKPYLYGNHIGQLGGSPQDALRNAQTLACIRDMQHIAASHRWASLLDRGLFVEGWNLGAKWAFGESHTQDLGSAHIDESAFNKSPKPDRAIIDP